MKAILLTITCILGLLVLWGLFRPRLLCGNGISGHQSAAAATLKSAVFAAQVQMQAGAYLDDDGNAIGEYAFLNHLTGAVDIPGSVRKGEIALLTGSLADEIALDGQSMSSHHYFQVYLPDGRGGFYAYDGYQNDLDRTQGAHLREQIFVAVAWPAYIELSTWQKCKNFLGIGRQMHGGPAGRRVFMMMQDGQLRSCNQIKVRSAFMDKPGWQHFFKGPVHSLEDAESQLRTDEWPYYNK